MSATQPYDDVNTDRKLMFALKVTTPTNVLQKKKQIRLRQNVALKKRGSDGLTWNL